MEKRRAELDDQAAAPAFSGAQAVTPVSPAPASPGGRNIYPALLRGQNVSPAFLGALIALISVAAWLLLRQPGIRGWLLALVIHRYRDQMRFDRSLLAPRSILLAGAVMGAATCLALLVPRARAAALRPIPPGWRLAGFFGMAQAVLGIAVVFNLAFYYHRTLPPFPFRVDEEKVLAYLAPQAYPDAQTLRRRFPPDTGIALICPEAFNTYLLASFGYPLAFYDIQPKDPEHWRTGREFAERAASRKAGYMLEYSPHTRDNPFKITPLR